MRFNARHYRYDERRNFHAVRYHRHNGRYRPHCFFCIHFFLHIYCQPRNLSHASKLPSVHWLRVTTYWHNKLHRCWILEALFATRRLDGQQLSLHTVALQSALRWCFGCQRCSLSSGTIIDWQSFDASPRPEQIVGNVLCLFLFAS